MLVPCRERGLSWPKHRSRRRGKDRLWVLFVLRLHSQHSARGRYRKILYSPYTVSTQGCIFCPTPFNLERSLGSLRVHHQPVQACHPEIDVFLAERWEGKQGKKMTAAEERCSCMQRTHHSRRPSWSSPGPPTTSGSTTGHLSFKMPNSGPYQRGEARKNSRRRTLQRERVL